MRGSLASTQEAHPRQKSILQSGGPGRGTDRWKGPARRPRIPRCRPRILGQGHICTRCSGENPAVTREKPRGSPVIAR